MGALIIKATDEGSYMVVLLLLRTRINLN
jgi:hypothetical protein